MFNDFNAFGISDTKECISDLNKICQEHTEYENKLRAIYALTNISDVVPCPNNHNPKDKDFVQKIMSCPICRGTRYKIILKSEIKEEQNSDSNT